MKLCIPAVVDIKLNLPPFLELGVFNKIVSVPAKNVLGGTQTHNPWFQRPILSPLGHRNSCCNNVLYSN